MVGYGRSLDTAPLPPVRPVRQGRGCLWRHGRPRRRDGEELGQAGARVGVLGRRKERAAEVGNRGGELLALPAS